MEIRISIIALVVSITSFLFTLATHLRQLRLQVVQSYQKMRIDVYEMMLSLSKVASKMSSEESHENEECIKQLSSTIAKLEDIKEVILKVSKISPWMSCLPGYSILEMEREQIKGYLDEFKRDVLAVCEEYCGSESSQAQEIIQNIEKVKNELT